jgi:hypothetical protein
MMLNVCGVKELLKLSVTGEESPPPEGVTVTVPVKDPFGVTVKLEDAVPVVPPNGPESVYPVAAPLGATGLAGLAALDAVLVPTALVAVTVHVYAIPFASPGTTIGLAVPVAVLPPHVAA